MRLAATLASKPSPGLQHRLHCQVAPLHSERSQYRIQQASAQGLSSFEADLKLRLQKSSAFRRGPFAMHKDRSRDTIRSHPKAMRLAAILASKPRPGLQHRLHCQVARLHSERALLRMHQASAQGLSNFESDLKPCLKKTIALR